MRRLTKGYDIDRVLAFGMRLVQTFVMSGSSRVLDEILLEDWLNTNPPPKDWTDLLSAEFLRGISTVDRLLMLAAYSTSYAYAFKVYRFIKQFIPQAILVSNPPYCDRLCRLSELLDVMDIAYTLLWEGGYKTSGMQLDVPEWLDDAVETGNLGAIMMPHHSETAVGRFD